MVVSASLQSKPSRVCGVLRRHCSHRTAAIPNQRLMDPPPYPRMDECSVEAYEPFISISLLILLQVVVEGFGRRLWFAAWV
jgi:hypothetical protein